MKSIVAIYWLKILRVTALLAGLALVLVWSSFANAVTQTRGPGATGNCTDDNSIGTLTWTNPGNAFSSNNVYATRTVDGTTSHYIKCLNYGFTIPATATILGITVNVERKSSSTANGGSFDAAMRIVQGGTIGTSDRSTTTQYTTADVTEAHGGATDLWGLTWTPADINAANFGAAFAATKPSSAGGSHTVSVDFIEITVDYTTDTIPPTVSSITRVSANPTNAASVQWTVTFSEGVTGVDASAFTLAASGLSGAFISDVTGSGATWTITANTGIGSGTLGLNQTSAGSVADLAGNALSGTFTGEVYTISATPALVEYHMDETGWAGTAGEVADSSGSGLNATAANSATTTNASPAIAGDPGTCRYGIFDNGGTITQGYVAVPVGFPNLTADFTITAWIRTTNNTFTGQRIFIDDQNNTGGYGFSLADGAAGRLRFFSRSIAPISLDSTFTIANNTWYFVAAVADINNQIRTIYVYNSAGVLQNSTSDAAAFTGTWGTDAGPPSIGGETNASAEATSGFHFHGNIDELRVFQKVLSQNALAAMARQTHPCTLTPDHFAITHSGTGVTCQAVPITITAHDAAHALFPMAAGTVVNLSTSTAHGDWSLVSGAGTLTNSGNGVAQYVSGAESSFVLNLKDTFAETTNINILSGAVTERTGTASADVPFDPDLVMVTSGFQFVDNAGVATIGAQLAGKASNAAPGAQTLYLQAIRTDTNTGACAAVFNGNVSVDLASECQNPTACAGRQVSINGTAIAANNNGAVSTYTSVPAATLNFGTNSGLISTAPIALNYPDVGQIKLYARYNIPRDTTPSTLSGNYMMGNSNSFVVKPGGFALSGIQQTAAPNTANPAATDATGAKFVKAGESFSATVTATTIDGVTATPNYGKEVTPEGVKLTANLVAPAGGAIPALANPTAFGAFSSGVATGTTFNWGEVGIITLTPSVGDGDYLGAGDATGTASGNVGRFYPADFNVNYNAPQFTTGCATGNFTYLDQPFTYLTAPVLTVTARNLSGTTTTNYRGTSPAAQAFFKLTNSSLTPSTQSARYAAATGTLNVSALPDPVIGPDPVIVANGNGTGTLTFSSTGGLKFTRAAAPAAPFNADIALSVNVIDTDSVAYAGNPTKFGQATAGNGIAFSAGKEMRFGRATLANALGSELLALPVPLHTEYYNGSGFVTNTQDGCIQITSAMLTPSAGTFASVPVGGGTTTGTIANNPVLAGDAGLSFSAPGTGNVGDFTLQATLGALPWLRYDWDGNGVNDNDPPPARISFGTYSGSKRQIYIREPW